ncbi:MAG: ABC transporter ATP-binding protein [Acidimicrobiales bacterium]|nr:ABC transporter ATP-binding protein [Acidimicrobiales bacterium]
MTGPVTASSRRFAWRVLKADPWAWGIALVLWVVFFTAPLPAGLALRAILDQLPDGDGAPLALLFAVLAGFEVGRWVVLLPAIVQWHGAFAFWHTVPRVNALRSLVHDPGPVTDRLPGSPGEAVSRFRDDARDIAQVLDVWLDIVAALLATTSGIVVLALISVPAAIAIVAPILLVLVIGHLLAERLRRWRWIEREATAGVTGFIGDAFGAIGTVKVAAAEPAVVERFEELGQARADAARRDQVGTQLAQTLGGITANAGLGLALIAIAPAVRRGDLSAGDIGLFTAYATVVAGLPRITARWSAWQRQAEVSAARLARLLPEHADRPDVAADRASAPVTTWLRSGPPPFAPRPAPSPAERTGDLRLERLEVRNLHVRFDEGRPLTGVDLTVPRGAFVAVTGPVGSGKSVLVRALLGLVPRAEGTIAWNGAPIDDPAAFLVPPRAAYVPQVPRLFSESLADTVLLGVDGAGLAEALRRARLDEDLADLADGTDTRVGPKGVRLSGGQVQRAAAARAFVRRPELLVVDDLSSALDVDTEAELWEGLFEVAGELTVIAVSHRPAVLERADEVVELRAGRRISRP